jgi:hypothetical protein
MRRNIFTVALLLCGFTSFAQQQGLSSILQKASGSRDRDYDKLENELKAYSKSKPVVKVVGRDTTAYFEKIGVGIDPVGRQGYKRHVNMIVVYPDYLKETVLDVEVAPKATFASVLNGLKKERELEREPYIAVYGNDSLLVEAPNYFFCVRKLASFNKDGLTAEKSSWSDKAYYKISSVADLRKRLPDLDKMKVYFVATQFPPPLVQSID